MIYENKLHEKGLLRMIGAIELYEGYCDYLIEESLSLDLIPADIVEMAADESIFLLQEYKKLQLKYTEIVNWKMKINS
ncbi:hypothetical protein ACWOFR_07330 [Carnobacterium gallinarum]|uniref:hypothetical protein n=1 Tax=Carnobacterium gallinarum TaxID=2749 RepID=UPI00054EB765|nr:hypothetical protein [Carnobacterium gallinarum]